jgi:prepilin-type N-terminal cleavage/methylation domain-containing protein
VSRAFRDRGRAEHGFTLIEVLISALIVTLIAGAVAGGLMANVRATADQHRRTAAQALVEQDQERLKGLSAEQLDNLSQTYTTTLDTYRFTVTSQAWYLNSTTGASCTTSGGAGATYFKTISTVTWTNPSGVAQSLATDESVITPPAGGSLLAQFHDQTTAPLSGVAVAASGPDADAATSDGNGCVIFTGLPTGNYNLTYTDSGYVDPNGNASPIADTANVASTGIGTPSRGNPIELGQGGGITASFGIDQTGSTPVAFPAPALAWYGSGGGYAMSNFRMNDPTGSSTSLSTLTVAGAGPGGLFPFASLNPTSYTNNYQLWAGICRQEQPPAGIDAASVTPGLIIGPPASSPSMSVTAPAIDVNVTYKPQTGSVQQVAPTDVKITFASTSGTNCGETWGPFKTTDAKQVVSNPLTYRYAAPFASSATTGSAASASGQTGQITSVCADYTTGGKTYKYTYTPSSGGFSDQFGSATAVPTMPIQWTSTASGAC